VLEAVWTLLEAAAPTPTRVDVTYGDSRIHLAAVTEGREIFLDARPPATLNLNRDGAPPALFFPAALRTGALLAPADHGTALVRQALDTRSDGGLELIRAMRRLVEQRARGYVILVEEPELFLSPPAQRHLHALLRRLARRGRNQVLYSTHSPVFLGVDNLDSLVLVRHGERSGTVLLQPEPLPRERTARMLAELDSERAEIFLSRAVLLVEGRTEKLAFPYVFEALGYDHDQEAIAIVDCAGKGNIPLLAEICSVCGIPFVVVHDRDAPRGAQPPEAERVANDVILRLAGRRRTITLVPDFEAVSGLHARRGKPAAALRRFRAGNGEVPPPLRQAVERVVAAARRAPRSTRGA
jgi:hypothetical protein